MKRVQRQTGSTDKRTLASKVSYVKRNWQLYVFFLMPALLLTIIFKYLPMGGLLIAFEDYNVIKGVLGSPWVGLEYFRRFLSSPDFMNYLLNTLKLSIFGLLWSFPIPIILALLLNRIRKAGIKKKIQLLIYAPNFISVIVLCGMVRMFLSPVGPLNRLLGMNTNWMTMPSAFRTIYIASGIWQGAGWASIMYTAALSNASKELEEAATMDGASSYTKLRTITLPLVLYSIAPIIITQYTFNFNNFNIIYLFNNGGPAVPGSNAGGTDILVSWIYKLTMSSSQYSVAAAITILLSIFVVGVALWQFTRSSAFKNDEMA